jgi:predicted ATPase
MNRGHVGLVGRDAQVGVLRAAVQRVAAGRGGSVLVDGEPGIGKSAVVAAGVADAKRRGCRVFR